MVRVITSTSGKAFAPKHKFTARPRNVASTRGLSKTWRRVQVTVWVRAGIRIGVRVTLRVRVRVTAVVRVTATLRVRVSVRFSFRLRLGGVTKTWLGCGLGLARISLSLLRATPSVSYRVSASVPGLCSGLVLGFEPRIERAR